MDKHLTLCSAVTTIITSMMGTSIYFIPLAFRCVGYVYGWIIMGAITLFTAFSLYCIAYTTVKTSAKEPTYSSLAGLISPAFKHVADVSVVVNSFTANLCLYRYLSELIVRAFPALSFFSSSQETVRKGVVVVLLGPLFVLSSHKNLSSLRYMSFVTVVSVVYFVLLLIGYSVSFGPGYVRSEVKPAENGFSTAIPILITAMACQSNMVKIQSEMVDGSMRNALLVSICGSIGGGLAYGLVGFFGYALFGHRLQGDVLREFADRDSEINRYIATHTIDRYQISSRTSVYGCILIFLGSFPLQLSPIINTLVNIMPAERRTNRNRMLLLTALLVSCFLLVMVENLSADLVISIAGATITNAISFLFPFVYFIHAKKRVTAATVLAGMSIILCVSSSVYMLGNILMNRDG